MRIKLFIFALILNSINLEAADLDERHVVIGVESCGKYLNSNKETRLYFRGWLNGFLSAYNQYQHKGANVTFSVDAESIELWLEKYCKDNPLNSYYQATQALLEKLKTK